MEKLKNLKMALKTWEANFLKENGRKPNSEDIGLSSENIRSAYSRYYQLKKQLANCSADHSSIKDDENTVWGKEFNRTPENNSDGHRNSSSDDLKVKQAMYLEKLSTKMFINSKRCDAMKKIANKNLLQQKSAKKEENSKRAKTNCNLSDLNTSENDISLASTPEEKNVSSSETGVESSGTKVVDDSSPEESLQLNHSGLFKNVLNISSRKRNVKSDATDSLVIPRLIHETKNHKFSLSASIADYADEEISTDPVLNRDFKDNVKTSFDSFPNSQDNSDSKRESNDMQNIDFQLDHVGPELRTSKDTQRNNKDNSFNKNTIPVKLELKRQMSPESNKAKRRKISVDTALNTSMSCSNNGETTSVKDSGPYSVCDKDCFSSTEISKEKIPRLQESVECSSSSGTNDSTLKPVKSSNTKQTKKTFAAPKMSQINKSENFVRLNMKVKRFSKKGQGTKGAKFKRLEWKRKMRAKQKSYGERCFRCGENGHWAKNCKNVPNSQRNKNIQHEQTNAEYSSSSVLEEDYLTLSQAVSISKGESLSSCVEQDELEIERSVVRDPYEMFNKFIAYRKSTEPYLVPNDDGTLPDIPGEVYTALQKFGFSEFKDGQSQAIMRTLCGLSTLVILSTGGGKSLCYQLPAYLYGQRPKHVAIIISPLVSLMEDQVEGLPIGINGACLHTNMTHSQRELVITSVNSGKVHFLLLSPEAVIGGQKSVLTELSKDVMISFACIDEAHCLSEWSHNFRPSYLQVCKILKEKHGVQCFIGLTATATLAQSKHIAQQLGINDVQDAVIRGAPIPKNLVLTVSRDIYRDESLIELLEGERFSKCESIIIYCTRRDQTEKIATLIRTALKDKSEQFFSSRKESANGSKSKKTPKNAAQSIAESYHAGLTAYQRKRIQKAFMSGRLWIVVATVAFGMGIDKSNVRGVIHYNMPKSFESYVQEIGRAGRDSKLSHCHLFIDKEGQDLGELKKHIYANSISRFIVKKFIQSILKPCRCLQIHARCSENLCEPNESNEDTKKDSNNLDSFLCFNHEKRICKGHEVAVSIEPLVQRLDIKEENISTLFCYLELSFPGLLRLLPLTYAKCKINCYGGAVQLQGIAKKCSPVAVAVAKQKLEGKKFCTASSVEFPVIELSDSMGWNSGIVKRELKSLQWSFDNDSGAKKSGVLVELSNLAFHFVSFGDLSDNELDHIIDYLYNRVKTQEKIELGQIQRLHQAVMSVSYNSICGCLDNVDEKRNKNLHQLIFEYFEEDSITEPSVDELSTSELSAVKYDVGQIRNDMRRFLSIYSSDHNFTGHSIARILHGIGSPCYPANIWGRVRRFWRSYLGSDFQTIVNIATEEIINYKH
ncbi:ATP-dependent DNA helicase Q4 [Octopus bimaculoides]|uniref:DNA 3'-5' helicase n=1 Tax=Octopus bimaculoides TaxID=37653 RepID=A0A0L8G7L8_OCTBM|nr:ATP-dependent DNA helicase Q4 [Octopus bimaculoides]|eukprot:XP_014783451.1 PREDICTED: ATP-dependent DNA helicase Q4-like [Octopus bimaculoides]